MLNISHDGQLFFVLFVLVFFFKIFMFRNANGRVLLQQRRMQRQSVKEKYTEKVQARQQHSAQKQADLQVPLGDSTDDVFQSDVTGSRLKRKIDRKPRKTKKRRVQEG